MSRGKDTHRNRSLYARRWVHRQRKQDLCERQGYKEGRPLSWESWNRRGPWRADWSSHQIDKGVERVDWGSHQIDKGGGAERRTGLKTQVCAGSISSPSPHLQATPPTPVPRPHLPHPTTSRSILTSQFLTSSTLLLVPVSPCVTLPSPLTQG